MSVRRQSRPTTPLRRVDKGSLSQIYNSASKSDKGDAEAHLIFATANDQDDSIPLDGLEPAFAELSDAVADLATNFRYLNLCTQSLADFNESFASFLYGLQANAFCVDFLEAPTYASFQRLASFEQRVQAANTSHHQSTTLSDNQSSITSDNSFNTAQLDDSFKTAEVMNDLHDLSFDNSPTSQLSKKHSPLSNSSNSMESKKKPRPSMTSLRATHRDSAFQGKPERQRAAPSALASSNKGPARFASYSNTRQPTNSRINPSSSTSSTKPTLSKSTIQSNSVKPSRTFTPRNPNLGPQPASIAAKSAKLPLNRATKASAAKRVGF